MTTYKIKQGRSKKENCRMFGIYPPGAEQPLYTLFNIKNAKLVVEYLLMIDQYIVPRDHGMNEIMKVIGIDRRKHDDKFNNTGR